MKYMRKTTGYNWTDYKTNTETEKELNITSVLYQRQKKLVVTYEQSTP